MQIERAVALDLLDELCVEVFDDPIRLDLVAQGATALQSAVVRDTNRSSDPIVLFGHKGPRLPRL